jgi:hypothetical protein
MVKSLLRRRDIRVASALHIIAKRRTLIRFYRQHVPSFTGSLALGLRRCRGNNPQNDRGREDYVFHRFFYRSGFGLKWMIGGVSSTRAPPGPFAFHDAPRPHFAPSRYVLLLLFAAGFGILQLGRGEQTSCSRGRVYAALRNTPRDNPGQKIDFSVNRRRDAGENRAGQHSPPLGALSEDRFLASFFASFSRSGEARMDEI